MISAARNLSPLPIIKIATTAQKPSDSTTLLALLDANGRDFDKVDLIGIAMGSHGIDTRVLGPAHGSYLTFAAAPNYKGSAPGQLSIDKLVGIWDSLGYER